MSIRRRIADRENAFIALFACTFGDSTLKEMISTLQEEEADYRLGAFGQKLLDDYAANAETVDNTILARLKGWRLERLSKVSLSVLRLAVTEMLFGEEEIESVIINEAVELSKKYGDEKDYRFINGVLGNIARSDPAITEPSSAEDLTAEPMANAKE